MLKRLWFVISAVWAACVLAGAPQINEKFLIEALAPFALGWFIAGAGRFVVTGSVLRARA